MAAGFDVHTQQFSDAAPRFAEASAELKAALSQLQSALTDCAEMCGDDDQGRAFAKGYEPAARMINDALAFAVTGVAKVGSAVKGMEKDYLHGDETNARALKVHGGL